MKRSPLSRRTPLVNRTPMRRASRGPSRTRRSPKAPKPATVGPDWQALREALYARAGGRCELGGCSLDHLGLHAHHRKLRSLGGKHDLPNLAALCPGCHSWVHAEPAHATRLGFMVTSTADPASAPVLVAGAVGWVLLTESGGYGEAAS